jgi:transposase
VLTRGYSRRLYAEAFEHERLHAWLTAMENAFSHFGGIPQEVRIDNARRGSCSAVSERHQYEFRSALEAIYGAQARPCWRPP